jgi:hypothetical protein
VYLTKHGVRGKHIDLLLLKDGDKSHYTWIKSMSRMVHSRTNSHCTSFVCPHCINAFSSEIAFVNHFSDCSKNIRQKIEFPEKTTVEFKDFKKTERMAFTMYSDFEAIFSPIR